MSTATQKRIWRKEHLVEFRAGAIRGNLNQRHHITEEDYNRLLVSQNGVCKKCKHKETLSQRLSVAHNKVTGEIIGLICHRCLHSK